MHTQHWAPHIQHIRQLLLHNNLRSFDDIWKLKADWIEPCNIRRGGWSGVCRIELKTQKGDVFPVYLKRQQDHNTRSLRDPFSHPTLREEFDNICTLKTIGIPTVSPVYYGEQQSSHHTFAALMTVALDDCQNLDDWWQSHPQTELRHAVMHALAYWVAEISKHHLQHGCLYAKHIFIHTYPEQDQFSIRDIRFIDLEKMRHSLTTTHAADANIKQLLRHSASLTPTEHQSLLHALNDVLTAKSHIAA